MLPREDWAWLTAFKASLIVVPVGPRADTSCWTAAQQHGAELEERGALVLSLASQPCLTGRPAHDRNLHGEKHGYFPRSLPEDWLLRVLTDACRVLIWFDRLFSNVVVLFTLPSTLSTRAQKSVIWLSVSLMDAASPQAATPVVARAKAAMRICMTRVHVWYRFFWGIPNAAAP